VNKPSSPKWLSTYPQNVNGHSFGQEHKIIIRKILIKRPKHTAD